MNLYWDIQNQRLAYGLTSTAAVTGLTVVLRDTLPVRLYIVAPQASATVPYAVTDIEAGQSIAFGAKKSLADEEFATSQNVWTGTGSGTAKYYAADIPLNTSEMIAALDGINTLTLTAEFTIVGSDNSHRLSTQFALTVNRDVIVGDEGTVTTQYPVAVQFVDDDGVAGVRLVDGTGTMQVMFKSGVPWLHSETTGLWYPLTVHIVDGQAVPGFGEGVAI